MTDETQKIDLLSERLVKLEKEIRRLRRASVLLFALLALTILGLHLQSHRKLSADEIVAREFVVASSSGTASARMTNFPGGSGLEIYAANGERRAQLIAGGEQSALNLYTPVTSNHSASLNLFYEDKLMSSLRSDNAGSILEMHSGTANGTSNGAAILSLHRAEASFTLNGAGENVPKISMESEATHACEILGDYSPVEAHRSVLAGTVLPQPAKGIPRAALCINSPGLPVLDLRDVVGDHAILGVPPAGRVATSAASLSLTQKSGKSLHFEPR